MSSLGSPNPFFIAGKKAYEVERSLRFNDDDSAYLRKSDYGSPDSSTTFTFSAWIKRANLDVWVPIAGSHSGSNAFNVFGINPQNELVWRIRNSSGSDLTRLESTQVLRDPNAWYHLLLERNSTLSTAGDRAKLYINGVRVTDFSQNTKDSQNLTYSSDFLTDINIGRFQRNSSTIEYGDFYLAEYHYIDGQAYDPSYFTETDPITGQLIPKKYTGGYGSNGFYLNFSTNTLGTDRSGNSNDFTPNNFSVSAGAGNDALSDTPTNNFATMNPLVPSPTVTWSNGNLDLTGSSSSQYSQNNTSTFGVSSGKWYAEVKYTYSGTTNAYVGICPITAAADANMTGSVTDAAVLRMNNETYIEGTSASSGTSIDTSSSGYTIGIALDMDNQKVWFSVQGTYINSGNPSTGANATFDGITAGETIAICARPLNNTLNFNFGQRDFEYTPPTGFKTLCSANLSDPTILLPNKHFAAFTYTGTGSSGDVVNITNSDVDFTPDWVWVKTRDVTNDHILSDSVRGGTKYLVSSEAYAEQTNTQKIRAFIQNGFESGTDGDTNWTGSRPFVAWNWNAGDTDGKTYTVTVVSDSGNKYRFDGFGTSAVTLDLAEGGTYIFNYPSAHPFRFSTTSDGTHGGGTEYTTGVTVLSSTSVQIVVAASAPQLHYFCSQHSGMGGAINTNSTLGSSNFDGSVQSTAKVNASAGFSIVTLNGTGSVLTFGHGLGVKPNAVILKARNIANNWLVFHQGYGATKTTFLDANSSTSDNAQWYNDTEPTSSVFTLGTWSGMNTSTPSTIVAYCFSEVEGYSKFGSYTGNASSDGTFVYTGFRVAWLMTKRSDSTSNWAIYDNQRDPDNPIYGSLLANLSNSESTGSVRVDFVSNGFKHRNSDGGAANNISGATYIYFAFAESPFKNARAR